MKNSRRNFIRQLSAGSMASTLPLSFSVANASPSDQLNIALVGARGVGWANLRSHLRVPGVNLLAICDVDQRILDSRTKEAEEITGKKPLTYKDFRKLYENKDLDAVIIATPDHWHAIQTIQACQAGLDVYVEKPLANSIEECRAIENAVKRYGRIVQVGQQQRSGVHWQHAMNYIREGKIGKVNRVRAWVSGGSIISPKPDTAAPAEVDYKMWLGPAPERPFNENRFHGTFRYFWDYAGGMMTDWGVHLIDMVLMGMNASAPKSVLAGGGKYVKPDSPAETPDTMNVVYEFDDFLFNWEHNQMHWMGPYDKHHG
ncbi:MAG: Gfo/Idh/MocA family protein, partial [bacterium]